jgi:hypothetical protein
MIERPSLYHFRYIGRVLYPEEDTLARFLPWLGGRGGSTETLFSERGSMVTLQQVAENQ